MATWQGQMANSCKFKLSPTKSREAAPVAAVEAIVLEQQNSFVQADFAAIIKMAAVGW